MAGDDLGNGGAGGSATGVFATVPKERVEEEPVRAAAVPAAPAAPAANVSSGGFTQLLRALNYDAVKEAPAAAPAEPKAPSSGPGGPMTQLLRTISAGDAGVSAVEKPIVSPSSSQVTSFRPQSAPVVPVLPAATSPAVAPVAPRSTPGSFTQLFQRLEVESAAPVPDKIVVAPAAPVAAPPGSFTQLFATDAPVEAAAPLPIAVEGATSMTGTHQSPSVASSPGSFTQLFQVLDTPAVEDAPPLQARVADATKDVTASGPGEFTRMFHTLDEEPPQRETAAGPGSFTQLIGSSPMPAEPQPSTSQGRPYAASSPEYGERGASQIFETYKEPPPAPVERRHEFSPVEAVPMGRPPAPTPTNTPTATPSTGSMTQLLWALDNPASAPKPYAAPSYTPPVPTTHTGVYGDWGTPAAATPSVTTQPVSETGPSEFTRLINASTLREAALRGGGETPGGATSPPVAPSSGGPAMPGGLPAMPHASFSTPAAPSASISGPAGAHASASVAGGAHASFAAPHLPGMAPVSAVKLSEMSKAGAAPAGMQKYLPLLLILVIFLLLAVLVAVVVLMKK